MPERPPPGNLTIFLGYAAGVGKTYQMLVDAQDLKSQGRDVVIGYFEPHARKDTIARTEGLELVPRRRIEYRGTAFEEMDCEAILARHPEVCVVDEFPHTNVPGSERTKRWEDVLVLLEAGIDVLTTMNIQHLESLNDQIRQITGIRVRETIPDWVVKQAVQVVMVDVTPRALLNRLMRGVVYAPDKARPALENFFQESTLNALRELALRQTAHEVEARQEGREAHLDGALSLSAARSEAAGSEAAARDRTGPVDGETEPRTPQTVERILIHVTADPSSAMVIRRGKRVADYLNAECFAVAVQPQGDLDGLPEADREAIGRHLNFARNLHIEARLLEGSEVAKTLVDFARLNGVTHLFVAGQPEGKKNFHFWGRSLVQQIVRLAKDMQVIIVADRNLN
jgi:two-component system, OmpR family, sensor histidine kinase KdpD